MPKPTPDNTESIYTEVQARDVDYDVLVDFEDTDLEGEALMLFLLRAVEDWNAVRFEDEALEYFENHYRRMFDI